MQLYDCSAEVYHIALSILIDATTSADSIEILINLSPDFDLIKPDPSELLLRFIGFPNGMQFLLDSGYIHVVMDRWLTVYRFAYFRLQTSKL